MTTCGIYSFANKNLNTLLDYVHHQATEDRSNMADLLDWLDTKFDSSVLERKRQSISRPTSEISVNRLTKKNLKKIDKTIDDITPDDSSSQVASQVSSKISKVRSIMSSSTQCRDRKKENGKCTCRPGCKHRQCKCVLHGKDGSKSSSIASSNGIRLPNDPEIDYTKFRYNELRRQYPRLPTYTTHEAALQTVQAIDSGILESEPEIESSDSD